MHFLVLLAAGLALCYGESNNLTKPEHTERNSHQGSCVYTQNEGAYQDPVVSCTIRAQLLRDIVISGWLVAGYSGAQNVSSGTSKAS